MIFNGLCASFDPGLNCGLSVVERTATGYHVHYCRALNTDPELPKADRCRLIFKELEHAMRQTGARHLAIEENEGAQIARALRPGVKGNASSTDGRVMLTVGVALSVCFAYGYTSSWFQPNQAKVGLLGQGMGAASKKEVKEACAQLCTFERGCKLVLHSADSIAGAVYTLKRYGVAA